MSAPASDDLPEVFPPTLREVMLRGRWIAMLLLCLAVAAVFAWLGQWQLARAIDTAPREEGATEQVMPIEDVAVPGEYLTDPLIGQRVEVSGTLVPSDFVVVASRYNGGVEGYWVTAHLRAVDPDAALAVAVGWAASQDDADAVAEALAKSTDPNEVVTLTGRIVADEGPVPPPKSDPWEITRMSPAALLSRWQDIGDTDVYRQFVVADDPMGGLADIDSPAPDAGSSVNWLNIFYAAEWVIFAGFAFYLWYRLAKDAWEKELEELEELDDARTVDA